jgi:membrane-associated phospholipid phosphatase
MTASCPEEKIDRPLVPDLLRNVGLVSAVWIAYSVVRNISAESQIRAITNARSILDIQDRLGLTFEADLQALIGSAAIFKAANLYYLVHFPLTILVLMVTFAASRDSAYVRLRNSLIIVTGIAVLVHLTYPLAPPRMLPGFIDTGLLYGPYPYAMPGSEAANQFAAMPSMHVAWAVIVGLTIRSMAQNHKASLFAATHIVLTVFTVLLTAHHYTVDVVAGLALAILAWAITRPCESNAHVERPESDEAVLV